MEFGEFFIKLFASAGILSGLMFGIVWYMRKKGFIPNVSSQSSGMKIISSVRLTPKSYLFTVSIGEKRSIVVGVTDKSVSFICEIQNEKS
ncbi:MAG: flagellar biosynthetic protein FliO [Candidatus Calescibacterium sp.]|nr:flagellar biosynthetic protein FliO [Candidatus Calescibacterium sp.]MCX7734930.1 flagellar biosynthetic protein FliO [bacterium]MDW8088075.1 flagellar biosynthetic protein FliO [Candidatus Calescibacterium sp.]